MTRSVFTIRKEVRALTDGGFLKSCKRISNEGVTEVTPPKLRQKTVRTATSTYKPPKREKQPNTVDSIRRQLEEAIMILDSLGDRNIKYDERSDCLKRIIRATDLLRCTIPEDRAEPVDVSDNLMVVWKEHGYYVEQTDLGIKIVLPPVLGLRENLNNVELKHMERKFGLDDIQRFLQKEKMEQGIKADFLTDQVLVFTHERIRKGTFDYDNLSTSVYINAIADTFLSADNVSNIDFFQRFVRGEENRTIVHIVPKADFAKWTKSRY